MAKQTLVPEADIQEMPIAASTRKVYISVLAGLDRWLKGREVNDETLSGYLSYIFDKGKSPGTAQCVLNAVRWRCLSQDTPDPRGKRCRVAMKNFQRQGIGRGRGQVDGLTFEEADKLAALAAQENTPYGLRDAAVISVMSYGMLRIGEAAAVDVDHIDFLANTLYIPRSKTDQTGKGATQYLADGTLEHVRVWMEKAKITEGPLFRPIHKTYLYAQKRRLHTDTIRRVLKARCKAAGIEGRFSGHSLRVGSAQSLAGRGASIVQMQQVGRWSSPEMPFRYARKFTAQQSAMAKLRSTTQ